MQSDTVSSSTGVAQHWAHPLLALGIAAGPFYVLVGGVQALTRDGFDIRRHALSLLSNGDYGWIQTANFLIAGVCVIAGALGCRFAIRFRPGSMWGPILLGIYGVGLIGAGVFPADPGQGFPPGSKVMDGLSRSGLLHFVFGGIGFYALIAACFVMTRRFLRLGRKGLAFYSLVTGIGFFVSFATIASGSISPIAMISFYIAVVWIWVWHTLVLLHVVKWHGLEP